MSTMYSTCTCNKHYYYYYPVAAVLHVMRKSAAGESPPNSKVQYVHYNTGPRGTDNHQSCGCRGASERERRVLQISHPSGLILDISSTTDLLDRLRFSSLILEGEKIRRCSTQELKTSVSSFLDLHPDGYAVHQKSKRLAILEFTRAMDSSDDWELQKDAEKRKRYDPVLEFFNSLPDRQGWSLLQFNFTVGVRGSISTEDRTDPLYFVSTLKALGISSLVNLEKNRKRVAKRTFEAHDLMLRNYHAVKFSSSSSVDFSRLLGNSFALQHCLRLPI